MLQHQLDIVYWQLEVIMEQSMFGIFKNLPYKQLLSCKIGL
jgi:hypothetical protein